MSDMQVVFRRLADQDAERFRPWYKWSELKIFALAILAAVLLKWITS